MIFSVFYEKTAGIIPAGFNLQGVQTNVSASPVPSISHAPPGRVYFSASLALRYRVFLTPTGACILFGLSGPQVPSISHAPPGRVYFSASLTLRYRVTGASTVYSNFRCLKSYISSRFRHIFPQKCTLSSIYNSYIPRIWKKCNFWGLLASYSPRTD